MFSIIILVILLIIVNTAQYQSWLLKFKLKRLLAKIYDIHRKHINISDRATFENFELEYRKLDMSSPIVIKVRRKQDFSTLIATYTTTNGLTWKYQPPVLVMQLLDSALREYYRKLQSEYTVFTTNIFKDLMK